MGKVFEDEFMEIQSGLISLCMEAVEHTKVNKVYAYCSIEKSKMFNAFFEANGEIKALNQLGVPSNIVIEFLKIGTADLDKIKDVCDKYNMPTPTEIKMYYDVDSGKYNANYKYEEICSAKTGKSAGRVFLEWFEEIKG